MHTHTTHSHSPASPLRRCDEAFLFSEGRVVFQGVTTPAPGGGREPDFETTRQEIEQHLNVFTQSDIDVEKNDAMTQAKQKLQELKGNITVEQMEQLATMVQEKKTELAARRIPADDTLENELGALHDQMQQDVQEKKNINIPVSDIPKPTLAGKGGLGDQIKSFFSGASMGAFGELVKVWISIKRTWMSIFPPEDSAKAEAQMKSLEQLHDRFFGVSEAQSIVRNVFTSKGAPLALVEGTNDRVARAKLKERWQREIDLKLNGATSEEAKLAVRDGNTFESFVSNIAEEYIVTFYPFIEQQRKDGKMMVTTLTGIEQKQKPVEGKADAADTGSSFFSFLGFQ